MKTNVFYFAACLERVTVHALESEARKVAGTEGTVWCVVFETNKAPVVSERKHNGQPWSNRIQSQLLQRHNVQRTKRNRSC